MPAGSVSPGSATKYCRAPNDHPGCHDRRGALLHSPPGEPGPTVQEKCFHMKAAVFRTFGGPEVLTLEEVPTPEIPPGHVLVKVLAAGINRLEHYIRAGGVVPLTFPHVLGSD